VDCGFEEFPENINPKSKIRNREKFRLTEFRGLFKEKGCQKLTAFYFSSMVN